MADPTPDLDTSDLPPLGGSGRFRTVLFRPALLFTPAVRGSVPFLFGVSLVSSLLCTVAASFLFPEAAGLVAVSLLAFSLQEEMVAVLEENRDVIWVRGESPRRANMRLARKILALFLGMFLGFGVMTYCLSEGTVRTGLGPQLSRFAAEYTRIQGIDFMTAGVLFRHNLIVLVGCFLFALFFRSGGALLVLGWNASVWGAVFGYMARTQPSGRVWYGVRVFLATLPHVALEATGYILAALAGIFVSKAMVKYGLDTAPFRQVAGASGWLLAAGAVIVGAAAYAEAWGTPRLARLLFP